MAFDMKSHQELKSDEMMIHIISVFKSPKSGKTCLDYAFTKKVNTDNEKGYSVHMTQWFDNDTIFNKVTDDICGTNVKAKFEYAMRNNGSAYISITDLCI